MTIGYFVAMLRAQKGGWIKVILSSPYLCNHDYYRVEMCAKGQLPAVSPNYLNIQTRNILLNFLFS
jgi:hypothetical protein